MSREEILELKEKCLPQYVLHDIEEYLKYRNDESCSYLDCLQDEIRGSINSAFWDGDIDEELANYLREKYLSENPFEFPKKK